MEDDKFKAGWLSWLSIVASGLAICVSGYSLYMSLMFPKKK